MIIEETNIPNIGSTNIDQSKIILADNIIKNVYPLFGEIYGERQKKLSFIKEEIGNKNSQIMTAKDELKKLMSEYERKKKVYKLLTRIKQLVESGIINEGSIKYEMIILVKVVNKLSIEKIESQIKDTMSILTKRFARGV
jgi:hypothetical protein